MNSRPASPSGRSPPSMSAFRRSIRSAPTPSNSTTRAIAIGTLLRGYAEPKVPAPPRRYVTWARRRKGREFARRALLRFSSATVLPPHFERFSRWARRAHFFVDGGVFLDGGHGTAP